MEKQKGFEVLTLKWVVYWGSLAVVGVAIIFVGGCDMVADNPACLYQCQNSNSETIGGAV